MQVVIEDPRLVPIREKVEAGERLSFDDGVALYRTTDILAARLPGQPGARAPARRHHVFQRQPPHQPHRRVRGQLPAVRLRQARARSQGLHHVARRGVASRRRRLERSRHRIPHRGRAASGADAGLVLRDAARPQAALPAGASEGLHHGGDRATWRGARKSPSARRWSGCAMPAWIRCPAAARRSSTSACAASSATTRSTATSGSKPRARRTSWGCAPTAPCSTATSKTKRTAPITWCSLRALQDETHGFVTFIPLAFHPDNTALQHIPKTTGFADIKNIAVARLMLDNIPHIKAYWVMMTPRIAQIALRFGADDIDGTIVEERIYHDAGATTSAGPAPRRAAAVDPQSRPRAGGARHAVPPRASAPNPPSPCWCSPPAPRLS